MEESETLIHDLAKYVKKSQIKQINIPTKKRNFLIDDNIEFFYSTNVVDQINYIKKIIDKFDLCLVSSWNAARIAYLCDLNYIIFFIGDDIRIPPFVKNSKPTYFKTSVNRLNFLARFFYKKVLDNAIACVTGSQELYEYLVKYRKDAIRIDRVIVDTTIFNQEIKPINMNKQKFTFFCPQRIGIEKGTNIIWDAISRCKTDFDVLQIHWIDDKSEEAKKTSEKILKSKPKQVQLIPPVNREEMSKYYVFSDAVLGDMQSGHTNSIEREAAMCKKAVIAYNEPSMKTLIDNKEILSPFIPTLKNPIHVSEIIDKLVSSKDFREKVAEEEYDFIKELTNPDKAANEWDAIFAKLSKKYKSIKRESHLITRILRISLFLLSSDLHLKKS